MRKGFSLIEMLLVIVIIPVVLVAFAPLFRTLISEVPRSCRIVQENTNLLNMLRQMNNDVDSATALPETFAGYTTDDKLLLIELAEGMICYQLEDDKIIKRSLNSRKLHQEDSGEVMRDWLTPHGKVEWQVWRRNGEGYAVEVKTCIEYKIQGHWQKRMANSHLYFVGALREVLE